MLKQATEGRPQTGQAAGVAGPRAVQREGPTGLIVLAEPVVGPDDPIWYPDAVRNGKRKESWK